MGQTRRRWRCELRKGVKFHSGKEMDADDVVYTLNHVSNKDNAICQLRAARLDQERGEDRRATTCDIHLHNRPSRRHSPISPASASSCRRGTTTTRRVKPDGKKDFGAVPPNGTGPYKITEVKPGEHILMERNAAYFKDGFKGDPKISKITFRTIKDGNTRAAELMTGAIDWLWDVPKDQAERMQRQSSARGRERQDAARVLPAVRRPWASRGRSSSPTSASARPSRTPSTASRSPRTWSARPRS